MCLPHELVMVETNSMYESLDFDKAVCICFTKKGLRHGAVVRKSEDSHNPQCI